MPTDLIEHVLFILACFFGICNAIVFIICPLIGM